MFVSDWVEIWCLPLFSIQQTNQEPDIICVFDRHLYLYFIENLKISGPFHFNQ